ncbi:hypothetical protein TorRG33x02_144250, partial [Trema orientale]
MEDIIVQYILDYYMHCNTPWVEVDHVLMLVHVHIVEHRIVAHFDIHSKCLNVLNSLRGKYDDIKAWETISVVLPYFLDMVGFSSARKDLKLSSEYYANKKPIDPFQVYMMDGLFEQQL